MNKLLVITVLVALLALSTESFRVARQVEEERVEEEQGTLTKVTDTVKSYYNSAVNTASEYIEGIKGMKLEEKAMNLYSETTTVISTYSGILQDQLYHMIYQQ